MRKGRSGIGRGRARGRRGLEHRPIPIHHGSQNIEDSRGNRTLYNTNLAIHDSHL